MLHLYNNGDSKEFKRQVEISDIASFDSGTVHEVLATFALGRDAEWVCRLFVIDMKEADEEGIGTFLEIEHKGPAFVGETVNYTGIFEEHKGNNVICSFKAEVGQRLIATGRTGQKILKKEKINQLFNSIRGEGH
ncbi:MAG: thioesterase family protein [Bacteroidia bacterium]